MAERNFKLNASTIKPRTTLTELSQPPDLGKLFSSDGKMAKRVNGIANASEKPNIPTIGLAPSPAAASTSNAPTIGPTHDRLTRTRVRAMKKEPIKPPFSACASVLVERLLGRTISNSPKNEAAKARKSAKKMVLVIQCEMILLVKSAPRLVSETSSPSEVYMAIMLTPNTIALRIALNRFFCLLRKNETVMGIIGNTQGVSKPASPPKKAMKKNDQSDESVGLSFVSAWATATFCPTFTVKSFSWKTHLSSKQTWYSILPEIVVPETPFASSISCVKVTSLA